MSVTCVAGCGKQGTAPEAAKMVVESEAAESTESLAAETETETSAEEETEEQAETEMEELAEEETENAGITVMSATKYAKSAVNVRGGAGTEYDRLGGLTTNQKVIVTGQADNGWYRIDYNGKEGFVSDKYLVDEKVAVAASNSKKNNAGAGNGQQTQENPAPATANTENNGGSNDNGGNQSASSGGSDWNQPAPGGDNGGNQSVPTPPEPTPTPAPTPTPTPTPNVGDVDENGFIYGGTVGGLGTGETFGEGGNTFEFD